MSWSTSRHTARVAFFAEYKALYGVGILEAPDSADTGMFLGFKMFLHMIESDM